MAEDEADMGLNCKRSVFRADTDADRDVGDLDRRRVPVAVAWAATRDEIVVLHLTDFLPSKFVPRPADDVDAPAGAMSHGLISYLCKRYHALRERKSRVTVHG